MVKRSLRNAERGLLCYIQLERVLLHQHVQIAPVPLPLKCGRNDAWNQTRFDRNRLYRSKGAISRVRSVDVDRRLAQAAQVMSRVVQRQAGEDAHVATDPTSTLQHL